MNKGELSKFKSRVERWLAADAGRLERAANVVLAKYYSLSLPRLSWVGSLHWGVRLTIVVAPPAILFWIYEKVTIRQALVAAAALLVLQVLSDWLGGLREKRRKRRDVTSEEIWVRIGDILASVDSTATPSHLKDESVTACLGVIEGYSRQVTNGKKGDISVSLVLYEANDRTRMTIKHRNPGNMRPNARIFGNLERIFGHLACEAGPEPRRINNVLWFGRKSVVSPTQSQVDYKSIFIVPIEGVEGKVNEIVGFISIDSSRPYAFFGAIGDKILVTCSPLIDHIREQVG